MDARCGKEDFLSGIPNGKEIARGIILDGAKIGINRIDVQGRGGFNLLDAPAQDMQ